MERDIPSETGPALLDRGVKLSSGLKILTLSSGAGASFAGALAMGDHSVVRELARLLALVLVGCGGTPRVPQMEAGQPTSDAFAEEIESPDRWSDAAVDAVVDAQDARIDADPFQCSTVTPLVLSDPMVISGTVAGGQTVTVQITMTDTDPSGYVSYPGVVLTSSTPGVSFAAAEAGPPGSLIEGAASKPIAFSVKLDALQSGAGCPIAELKGSGISGSNRRHSAWEARRAA